MKCYPKIDIPIIRKHIKRRIERDLYLKYYKILERTDNPHNFYITTHEFGFLYLIDRAGLLPQLYVDLKTNNYFI